MKNPSIFLFVIFSLIVLDVFADPPTPPVGFVWELVDEYSDEFNGNSLDRNKWLDYHRSGWRGRRPAMFVQEAVSVGNGMLQIKNGILENPIDGYTIYGGAVTSVRDLAGFGYYECRFKASSTTMSTTFWLANDKVDLPGGCTTDKYSQELDIVETIGDAKTFPSFATSMHSNTHFRYVSCQGGSEDFYSVGSSIPLNSRTEDEFHVFGAWWKDATQVTFYANDVEGNTVQFNSDFSNTPFDRTMYLNMVTETYDFEQPPSNASLLDDSKNTSYYDWVRAYKLVPVPVQTAYPSGIPHSIPGTIEAEYYDDGGQGIAYNDLESANNGNNVFRENEGVDLEARDGGINVGWINEGEWLEYTVNAETKCYRISARVAAISSGKSIIVKLDGEVLGTIDVPNTGDWGAFQTVELNDIFIQGGSEQVLRLEFVGSGVNLNWVSFSATSPPLAVSRGNSSVTNASLDTWKSIMVINETDTYTNTSSQTESISLENFNFYAAQKADPVTPFIAKVNGNDNFTVLKVGTTRTSSVYNVGANSLAFSDDGEATFSLAPNETIAIGFLDANADGSASGTGAVIPFDHSSPDEIWLTGNNLHLSGAVVEGLAPISGGSVLTHLHRNYHFNIRMKVSQMNNCYVPPVTTILSPIHDAYLQGTTSYNNTLFRVEANNRVGYLMYDLSGINGAISEANLILTCNGDAGNGNININLGNGTNWTENNLSTTNAPLLGEFLANKNTSYAVGTAYTWALDATAINGGDNMSLIVSHTSGNDIAFATKENTVTGPQLVITYTPNFNDNARVAAASQPRTVEVGDLQRASIYPNPVTSPQFTLDLQSYERSAMINIFDVAGKMIYQTVAEPSRLQLDTSILPANGVYIFTIQSGGQVETLKMLNVR